MVRAAQTRATDERSADGDPTLGGPIVADTYRQVEIRLNALVEDYARRGRYQLPPEERLGAVLGVSRPTIRSALLSLQKEGKIQRLHGRGTFINRYALQMRANLSEDRRFLELLTRLGHNATARTLSVQTMTLPASVTRALEIPAGAPGVAIERLFEADRRPAVLSIDYLGSALLHDDARSLEPGDSTFDFLAENTEHRVQYSVAELIPCVPPHAVSGLLGLKKNAPVLLIRHLHVDASQQPVAVTDAYVNDAILRFSVVRTFLT